MMPTRFFPLHELVGQASGHSWRHSQGGVKLDPVVRHEIERQRVAVVRQLLRVRSAEPREPFHAHPLQTVHRLAIAG